MHEGTELWATARFIAAERESKDIPGSVEIETRPVVLGGDVANGASAAQVASRKR